MKYLKLFENWIGEEAEASPKMVNIQGLGLVQDLSGLSECTECKSESLTKRAFIVHHTGGSGTAEFVITKVLNPNKGINWIIDREGKIYLARPLGKRGNHILDASRFNVAPTLKDLSNSNCEGVEVIAYNDADVLPVQVEAGVRLIKALGYTPDQVFKHAEVNPGHRGEDEGEKIKNAFAQQYWVNMGSDLRKNINPASSTYVRPPIGIKLAEMSWSELQIADAAADQAVAPVDVVLTDKHFWDRLNDPRNGREITLDELLGFFERLHQNEKEFKKFLKQYREFVVTDKLTRINIPFIKMADQAIAKTIMRSEKGRPYLTSDKKLTLSPKPKD